MTVLGAKKIAGMARRIAVSVRSRGSAFSRGGASVAVPCAPVPPPCVTAAPAAHSLPQPGVDLHAAAEALCADEDVGATEVTLSSAEATGGGEDGADEPVL